MLGYYLFTTLFESAGDRRPRVARFYEVASCLAELTPAIRVAKQGDDRRGEFRRLIRADVVMSVADAEPFGSHRR